MKIFKLKKLKPKNILHVKKIKKKYIFLILIVFLIGVFAIKNFMFPKIPEVTNYSELQKGSIVNSIDVTGVVESEKSVNVYSKVEGNFIKVNVEEGDQVKEGDVLAVIDSEKLEREIRADIESINNDDKTNKIDLESKKRTYENMLYKEENDMNSDVTTAKTDLHAKSVALEEAQKNYDCNKELFNYGEISEKDLIKSENDLESAKKEYDQAVITLENNKVDSKDKIQAAKEELEAAELKVNDNSKKIELEQKKIDLQNCIIKAPISGTITASNAEEGQSANGTIFKIETVEDVYIEVPIKEVDILNVKKGQKVQVRTDAMEDDADFVEGEVVSINQTAVQEISDSSSGNSSSSSKTNTNATFKAKIKLKEANENIKIGMNAKTKIILQEAENIFVVPFDCIVDGENGTSIYVADQVGNDYIVKEVPVETGIESDVSVEIKGKGLTNKLLVINDPSNYTVGEKVKLGPAQISDVGGEAVE